MCFFFVCFFVFYFINISKFALPGVMLMYERTSKDRKIERKRINLDSDQSRVCIFIVTLNDRQNLLIS